LDSILDSVLDSALDSVLDSVLDLVMPIELFWFWLGLSFILLSVFRFSSVLYLFSI
jgi:hypothetical protein